MERMDAILWPVATAATIALAIVVCVCAVGCGSSTSKSTTASSDAGGSDAPTWTRVYSEVIVANSCNNQFCHAEAQAGGLVLTPTADAAYNALVGKTPTGDPCKGKAGLQRVTPGKPEQSLMYSKLSADPPVCGLHMPPTPYPHASTAQIALVRAWIAAGAKHD
ncbi:MAG TPA: hypothetical protein VF331_22025 [Polyangiales bacterium]